VLRAGESAPEVDLQPAFGRPISLPDDLTQGPVAVVCLGGLSTPDTRAAVASLQEASAALDRDGVRLIALTTSTLDRVQDFVSRYHVLFPVVSDPSGKLRACFGLGLGAATDVLRGLAREVSRPGRSLQVGRGWAEPGAYTPAACFVLARDARVVWSADGVPISAMVGAAELSQRG